MGKALGIGSVLVLGVILLLFSGLRSTVGTDGPVVRYETGWLPVGGSGMDAIVGGELSDEDGCLLLDGAPVVWPDGTSWDADTGTVTTPSGESVAVGDEVHGAGGMTAPVSEAMEDALAGCPIGSEGAVVFNSNSDLRVG